MIVDDDVIVRKGLSQIINWISLGAEIVFLADTGKSAVEFLKNNDVDIVISDIKMPDMDGLELAKYISENRPEILVVIISTYGEFEYAQKAIHYNVEEYLLKPINGDNIARIKRIVSDAAIKKKINEQKEKQLSGEYKQELSKVFISNDEAEVKRILEVDLAIESDNTKLIQEYYSNIISFLFDVSGGSSMKYISKSASINEMLKVDGREEIQIYVNNSIHKLMEIINIDKNNNMQILATYMASIIESEYQNPDMNVNMLAEKLGMDAFYIGTVFKACKDISMGKYINSLRLKEACRLLKETNLNVGEISAKVGYGDQNYFSRKFKEEMNMSPMEFRKK